MAIRRRPSRKFEREEVVAYIHGIDLQGNVAHILVHQRGGNVRFSGKLGEHKVSPWNAAELTNWVREASAVWKLDDAIGIPRGWMNTPEILAKLELIKINAAKRKQELVDVGQCQV